jgi:phosphodiesterase/alkaline phosphatase D-like protein
VFRFQYGPSDQYGSQTLVSESVGGDETEHEVSSSVIGLSPGTTYHFRVLATNFNGTTAGPDQIFHTPSLPRITGSTAVNITRTTATVRAEVDPGFSPTTYRVEYGTTDAYDGTVGDSTVGSDNSFHPVATGLAGLSPGTTYHFRIIASNAIGHIDGGDLTFVTAPAPKGEPGGLAKCKRGFVRRAGKCVKKRRGGRKHKRKPSHHRRGANR